MQGRARLVLASLSGFLAVAAGAFGAHGAPTPEAKALLETGGHYQLVHALAAIAAVVCFAIAEIFHLTGFSSDHLDAEAFVIAGLLCLALWACPGWPRRP